MRPALWFRADGVTCIRRGSCPAPAMQDTIIAPVASTVVWPSDFITRDYRHDVPPLLAATPCPCASVRKAAQTPYHLPHELQPLHDLPPGRSRDRVPRFRAVRRAGDGRRLRPRRSRGRPYGWAGRRRAGGAAL